MSTDRQLLLGLLALQCGFITKEQLVAAFSDWTSNKSRSLEQILAGNKAITPQQQTLLAALAEEHLKQHGADPERSLAALSSLPQVTHDLRRLADPDLLASLAAVQLRERDDPPLSTITLPNPHSRSSRFIILRKHAKGGLGQVSVALDSELNRHVALKEMLAKCADDPVSQQRFVQEAEITGQLEHPGIVPVYGLGTYGDGKPYYAMRFVEGDNLKRAVDKFHKEREPHQQLTGPRAVEFRNLLGRFVDVCNAIEYAHSRKVLHRDLKPDNILLGPYGETLVVDWGLAKALGMHDEPAESALVRPVMPRSGSYGETIEGSAIGTPAYMSPEQAEGKLQSLGPATDVYSLGATLYSVLTGIPPFQGDTVVDTLEKVRHGNVERPRKLWSFVPRPLEAICMKAMSLRPEDRYHSAKTLADEIEKWLADEPVSAFQEPMTAQMRRWIKRHPAIITSTVVATVLLILAASGISYLQVAHTKQLSIEKTRAENREKDAIAAVKRFGEVVANNPELKNNPNLASLRAELLKEPLGFYKLLKQRLQNDNNAPSRSLGRLAAASFELARLTAEIGDKPDAIRGYEESRAIWEQLARDDRTDTLHHQNLAYCFNQLGLLLHDIGKPDRALAEHAAAKNIWERLAREAPAVTDFQFALAESHQNLGVLYRETGKSAEARIEHTAAKQIQQQLTKDHPNVAEFENALAKSCGSLGNLLTDIGKPAEALAAYMEARTIFARLTDSNPANHRFQIDLAVCHNNIGTLLMQTGKQNEALEEAKTSQEKLARENPSVTKFQNELARSQYNLGLLLSSTGDLTKAQQELEAASESFKRLVKSNPSVVEFQNGLAASQHDLGYIFHSTGKPTEAKTSYESAKLIQEKLARENPQLTELQSRIGGTLNNLAILNLQANNFGEAKSLLLQAVEFQKRALVREPRHAYYRQLLRSHYSYLNDAAKGLGDVALEKVVLEGLVELVTSEAQVAVRDQRHSAISNDEALTVADELLDLAQRAYKLQKFSIAVRCYSDALKRRANMAQDRGAQIPYHAACCAVLASSGNGEDPPNVDIAAVSALRSQALAWLQLELTQWRQFLGDNPKPEDRRTVAQTLAQWQQDPDLASLRDQEKLAVLPQAERLEWESLWERVNALLNDAKAKTDAPAK